MAGYKGSSINPKKFEKGQIKLIVAVTPLAILMLLPIIFIFCHAFKPMTELFTFPPRFFVTNPTLDNFRGLMKASQTSGIPMSRYVFNSLVVTLSDVLLSIVLSTTAGFALSKLKFRGKEALMEINNMALMFVPVAVMIPRYLVIDTLNITNNYLAHILPLLAMPVSLFLVKQFIDQIPDALIDADRWILSKGNRLAKDVTENMDKFELGIAVQKVYDFIWDEFCDWYIEMTKRRAYQSGENPESANAALYALQETLTLALKMLHPFMPFLTEEIYCTLHPEEETIMLSDWPVYNKEREFPEEEAMVERCKEMVKGVRNRRSEMNVPPSRKVTVYLASEQEAVRAVFESQKEMYAGLIGASEVFVQADQMGIAKDAVSIVIPDAVVYIPLEDLVDLEKERERLEKERKRLEKELSRSKGMLNNERFLSKAPEAKVQEEKDKLEKYEQMMEEVKKQLSALK